MSQKEWIHEEVTSEGVRFTVRQQKTDLLKSTVKCLLATIIIFCFGYLLIDTAWTPLAVLIFIVCSIALIGLIPSIIFLAIPILIFRKPRSTFKVSEKEITFEEKPHRGNPDKIQLKDISSVSCSRPNGNSSHVTVNVTVAQPTAYWGRPSSRVTSRHLDHGRSSRVFISRSNRPYGLTCSQISGVRAA